MSKTNKSNELKLKYAFEATAIIAKEYPAKSVAFDILTGRIIVTDGKWVNGKYVRTEEFFISLKKIFAKIDNKYQLC